MAESDITTTGLKKAFIGVVAGVAALLGGGVSWGVATVINHGERIVVLEEKTRQHDALLGKIDQRFDTLVAAQQELLQLVAELRGRLPR